MSDTPETDAELKAIKSVVKDEFLLETMADFARKLERERDKYQNAILECLDKNCHLADGEDCTLIGLKRALL